MKLAHRLLGPLIVVAGVALATGAAMGALGLWAMHQASERGVAALQAAGLMAGLREQVVAARSESYRTLAMMSSLDDAAVKQVRTALRTQADALKATLATLPLGEDPEALQHRTAASELIGQFARQADKSIDLSGMDPNVGIGAMRAAEHTYGELVKRLGFLSQELESNRAVAAASQLERQQWATGGLLTLVLAATALSLALAWRTQRELLGAFAETAEVSRRVAAGDLNVSLGQGRDDEIGDLTRALGHMVRGLTESIHTVRSAGDGILGATTRIAGGTNDLSERTLQTSESLQHTASAMTQLAATVNQTAESARTATELARSAADVAARGGSMVSQVAETMNEINVSSRRIGDIIGTIDGIAFQTNILALNAAVEAARAGEQGRGFAVVAGEVRNLAQRSAAAAREIKSLIGTSVERVASGAQRVSDARRTMDDIVGQAQRVSELIAEISTASASQSRGLLEINAAVTQLDDATQRNVQLVQESSMAADSLKGEVGRLGEVVGRFRVSEPA